MNVNYMVPFLPLTNSAYPLRDLCVQCEHLHFRIISSSACCSALLLVRVVQRFKKLGSGESQDLESLFRLNSLKTEGTFTHKGFK